MTQNPEGEIELRNLRFWEERKVKEFLSSSIRISKSEHAPGNHSWSTFRNTSLRGKSIPDFAVCSCGEIRGLS